MEQGADFEAGLGAPADEPPLADPWLSASYSAVPQEERAEEVSRPSSPWRYGAVAIALLATLGVTAYVALPQTWRVKAADAKNAALRGLWGEDGALVWVGCFMDDTGEPRSLAPVSSDYGYTTATCSKACQQYNFMALQDNGRCLCGQTYAQRPKYQQVFDGTCGEACAGEADLSPTRYCGAESRNAVYQLKGMMQQTMTATPLVVTDDAAKDATQVLSVDAGQIVGDWLFGQEHSKCFIERTEDGKFLRFGVPLPKDQVAVGILKSVDGWLEAQLIADSGEFVGVIRVRPSADDPDSIESNFKYPGETVWGSDTQAIRAGSEAATTMGAAVQDWKVVTERGLNVREAPDMASRVLETKSQREVVQGHKEGDWLILDDNEGFMLIGDGASQFLQQVDSGQAGFMASSMGHSVVADSPSLDRRWRVVTANGLNVRSSADPDAEVVKTYPYGSVVTGRLSGDWVQLTDQPGFMLATSTGEQLLAEVKDDSGDVSSPTDESNNDAWTQHGHFDLIGKEYDAETMAIGYSVDAAKRRVEQMGYAGFAVKDGVAYLKTMPGGQLTEDDLDYQGDDAEVNFFIIHRPPTSTTTSTSTTETSTSTFTTTSTRTTSTETETRTTTTTTIERCKHNCTVKPPALSCLKWHEDGCDSIYDREACLWSLDGRLEVTVEGKKIHGQPCAWCGEDTCSPEARNRCEPSGWSGGRDPEKYVSATCAETPAAAAHPSLYCYALMLPSGYEPDLCKAVLAKGIGIFECEGFSVYSSEDMDLGTHEATGASVATVNIGGSLKVEYGGKWNTALNTPVFLRVWEAVIKDRSYKKHDWLVKADLDSVFFPGRLRDVLREAPMRHVPVLQRAEEGCGKCQLEGSESVKCSAKVKELQGRGFSCEQALNFTSRLPPVDCGCECGASSCTDGEDLADIFLVNCRFGLHGPVEVMTRKAMEDFVDNSYKCEVLQVHAWGEDKYLDHCLQLLGMRRLKRYELLDETACGQMPIVCGSHHVAFHPFKEVSQYMPCWEEATKNGEWP